MFSVGVKRMSHTAVQPSAEVNNRSTEQKLKKKKNNSSAHQQQHRHTIRYLYQCDVHLALRLKHCGNDIQQLYFKCSLCCTVSFLQLQPLVTATNWHLLSKTIVFCAARNEMLRY